MHTEPSVKRSTFRSSRDRLADEQTRTVSHKKSNGRKLMPAGEYVEDDFDKYETDRDRLVSELMQTGIGTKAAIAISGRLLEMSR